MHEARQISSASLYGDLHPRNQKCSILSHPYAYDSKISSRISEIRPNFSGQFYSFDLRKECHNFCCLDPKMLDGDHRIDNNGGSTAYKDL